MMSSSTISQLRIDLADPQFRNAHLGELYELIAEQLMSPVFRNTPRWEAKSVQSRWLGFSASDGAPMVPHSTYQHLVFTFGPEHEASVDRRYSAVWRRNVAVARHGAQLGSLSVGLSSKQATELKLKADSPRWIKFLLRAAEVMGLSARFYKEAWNTDRDAHEGASLLALRSEFWSMTFRQMLQQPYVSWPFCKVCWDYPNLISMNVLTDQAVLYYFAFVWTTGTDANTLNVSSKFAPVRNRLVEALRDSLLRLRHALTTDGGRIDDNPISMIAPVVLYYQKYGKVTLDIADLEAFVRESVTLTDSSVSLSGASHGV